MAATSALPVGAATQFDGRSLDWLDPLNWNIRRLPTDNADVLIQDASVTLASPLPGERVEVEIDELQVLNDAELSVENAKLTVGSLSVGQGSMLDTDSVHLVGNGQAVASGNAYKFNPTFIDGFENFNFGANSNTLFGIGGETPAGPDMLGPGHYARIETDNAALDGEIAIFFPYPFTPDFGQTYDLITVLNANTSTTGLSGEFTNAGEGDLVRRWGEVGFYISYTGGDGNDVVLTTDVLRPGVAPLSRPIGEDWLAADDWDTGAVPTASDDVRLDGVRSVIAPPVSGDTVEAGEIVLRNQAELALVEAKLVVDGIDSVNSLIDLVSSHIQCAGTIRDPGIGFSFNPSFVEAAEFIIDEPTPTLAFGIDGATPASPGNLGSGHYARVVAGDVILDGELVVFFPHDYELENGESFTIIEATNGPATGGLSGEFVGAPEGSMVTRQGDIGLFISYFGGDGNDVELTAQTMTTGNPVARPLPLGDGEWLTAANWDTGVVPDANTDVRLRNREMNVEPASAGATVGVSDVTLDSSGSLSVHQATMQMQSLAVDDTSEVQIFDSELEVGTLQVSLSGIGFSFNPSALIGDSLEFSEGTEGPGVLAFGIDGTTPAASGAVGPGHYATMTGDDVTLAGELEIFFPYDFIPSAGDDFQIVTINNPNSAASGLQGRFANAREGDAVWGGHGLVLVITYEGGDGNDVVLTAVPLGAPENLRVVNDAGGAEFQFEAPTQTGLTYFIEETSDVRSYWDVVESFPGNGAEQTVTRPVEEAEGRFYRYSVISEPVEELE